MYNPAHPGHVLQEYLEGMNITQVARHLHVSRVTLSRILNCRAGISAEMSLRLSAALGTHPSFWFDMQSSYEFSQAKPRKIPHSSPFGKAA
jgi:addiction module HigA family antidote